MVKYMFISIFDKLFYVIKKIIFSILVIYAYNIIFFPIGSIVSMNLFTIVIVIFLGFPGIIGLELFSLFVL